MSWLNNTTARTVLTIDGQDFSNELVSIQLTDQTIVNNGIVQTGGTILLTEQPGGHRLTDYRKTKFGRGKVVLIDLVQKGVTRRHPRGSLVIIDSSYDPETRSVAITVGCILALYQLTDNITNLRAKCIFPLPAEAGYTEIQAALQAESAFLYTDRYGVIQKRSFFGNDGLGSNKEGAAWVAVRDYTCLSSAPLGQGLVVPDKIVVGYTWQQTYDFTQTVDSAGNVYDEDITESTYWLEHPANVKITQTVCTETPSGTADCRQVAVNDGRRKFAVTKEESSRRNYGGPGGSLATEISITRGPAVELNGSYYSELYSWELARAGGDPEQVSLKGLEWVIQDRREKVYEYGTGGEVVKTIERQFKNYINAMVPSDWRASGGAEQATVYDPESPPDSATRGFLIDIPSQELYLASQVTQTWEYYDDRTVENTETIQSSASCNGVGIFPAIGERVLMDLDATNNGYVETKRRTSRGGLLNPDQPGRNPGGDPSKTMAGTITDESAKYLPTSAGSIIYNTNVPYAVPTDTEAKARERAAKFAKTVRALIEGDASGVRVAETMRPEIFNYYPGMPFSYYDRTEGVLLKLRMNATAWAINQGEAIMATDGVFVGLSNGTVALGSNTSTTYTAPSVSGETKIDLGRDGADVVEYISIDIPVAVGSYTGNGDDGFGIVTNWDVPLELRTNWNLQVYVSGEKVDREATILEVDGIGTIPSYGDSLLVSDGGVIIPDLFDPTAKRNPDKVFFATTGAPAADQTFQVITFAAAADQIFNVKTGPKPADQIFEVRSITDHKVAVAELPFMVKVFAEPADQIFEVIASAVPADRTFAVTRGPDVPNEINQVIVASRFAVTTGWAVPDRTFAVITGPAPAATPDQIFNISVGGQDAPPLAPADQIFQVTTSWAVPDRIFGSKVITEHEVVALEAPFHVTVFAEPADQTFDVSVAAPAFDQSFSVTVSADPADQVFTTKVIENEVVTAYDAPEVYSVSESATPAFALTGMGLLYEDNPSLTLTVGQGLRFTLATPANPMWIKDVIEAGSGDLNPPWARVTGQGNISGSLYVQFLTPGTYYYVSGSTASIYGTITVT